MKGESKDGAQRPPDRAPQGRQIVARGANPGLWLYGGRDTSIPVNRSIANLDRIRTTFNKDFTIIVFPTANHGLVIGGAICQDDGPRPGVSDSMFQWLLPHIGL